MATTRRRRPSKDADPAFLEALTMIAARIAAPLATADRKRLPVRMYLAGGAAMHYYTGARTTEDVDAVFSTRVLLPQDLELVSTEFSHRISGSATAAIVGFDPALGMAVELV